MKKLLFFLLLSSFAFGQEIVKDSATATGRYLEFRMENNKLILNSPTKLEDFKMVEGLLTTKGKPYFALKFTKTDYNSQVALQDLYGDQDFAKSFPNPEITFENIPRIKSKSVFTDKSGQKVYRAVYISAISDGLLYLFFMVPVDADQKVAEKQVADFMRNLQVEQNYYLRNSILHK